MKHSTLCAIAAWALCAAGAASAATVTLDFEGLKDLEAVNGFYGGGTGSLGSTGPNLGVQFNSQSLAIIDSDAGGSGSIANMPSGSTVMYFQNQSPVMSVAAGFTGSLSFFYASVGAPLLVQLFDDLNATGHIISQIGAPATDNVCVRDPRGEVCFWRPFTLRFDGTAKSALFVGSPTRLGFDDISFNTADPTPVPEPATPLLAGVALLAAAAAGRHRRAPMTALAGSAPGLRGVDDAR